MNLNLNHKRVFISGSTEGIGFAIAKQLLSEGAEIILNGRSEAKLKLAVEKLLNEFPHGKVSGEVADFSDENAVYQLAERLGSIDILINNVGIFEIREYQNFTSDDWDRNLKINLLSASILSQKLLPKMIEKNWGRVLFIGSEFADHVQSNSIQYGVTKAAISALSNGLSKVTKNTEVTVNTILAGATYSEGVSKTIQYFAEQNNISEEEMKQQFFHRANPNSLLGRFIEPDEIAQVAAFLVSPLALAINGTSVRVDAGNNPSL